MAAVTLPPVANQIAGIDGHRKPRRYQWGADVSYKGPEDCSKNLPIAHTVPIGVKSTDVECFMTPKAFQSDVGSLMRLTHNKKRRVPRDPTQALFPRNEPTRTNNQGSFVLSQPTRESLGQCYNTLYVTPWALKTLPDFTPEIKRATGIEQKKYKLLQLRQEIVPEPKNEYDAYRYTTIYRDSYSKNSLAADQSKVYLPPIQRKHCYAITVEEEQSEPEEEPYQEDIGAWSVPDDHVQDSGDDDQRLVDRRYVPFCESLINIRRALKNEGYSVPAIYTRQGPSYTRDFEDYIAGRDRDHSSFQPADVRDGPSPTRQSHKNLIRCRSVNLLTNTAGDCECPKTLPKRNQHITIQPPKEAQTRIKYSPKFRKGHDLESKEDLLRPARRVTFEPTSPEVHDTDANPSPRPYFSMRPTTPIQEDKMPDWDIDNAWRTDEMLEAGKRRKTLLPRLQCRDFKTLCHTRHFLIHKEQVPDLRDYRTYSKRVCFDGINSSVYRG